jgi:hypothetical protein
MHEHRAKISMNEQIKKSNYRESLSHKDMVNSAKGKDASGREIPVPLGLIPLFSVRIPMEIFSPSISLRSGTKLVSHPTPLLLRQRGASQCPI